MKIADIQRDTAILDETLTITDCLLAQPEHIQQLLVSRWLSDENMQFGSA